MFSSGSTCVIVTRFLESVLIERALLDVIAAVPWRCQASCTPGPLRRIARSYVQKLFVLQCVFFPDRHVHVLHGRSRHEVTRMRRSLLALFCGSTCWVLILCSAVYQSFGRTRSSSGSCLLGSTTRDHFSVSNGLPRTGVAVVASCVTSPAYPNTHWPRAPLSRSCWSQSLQLLLLLFNTAPAVNEEL